MKSINKIMNRDKIVITGIGAVAPNGNNVIEFWESLKQELANFSITYFNTDDHKVK